MVIGFQSGGEGYFDLGSATSFAANKYIAKQCSCERTKLDYSFGFRIFEITLFTGELFMALTSWIRRSSLIST
ncbi:MAG: hypothetical protein ACI9FB_001387 [Candidatus Azotimanducaceae bacterium]|jgi:hypothetical protein